MDTGVRGVSAAPDAGAQFLAVEAASVRSVAGSDHETASPDAANGEQRR